MGKIKIESFGDSLAGVLLVWAVLIILFQGDPDIADALRKIICDYAGLTVGATP